MPLEGVRAAMPVTELLQLLREKIGGHRGELLDLLEAAGINQNAADPHSSDGKMIEAVCRLEDL